MADWREIGFVIIDAGTDCTVTGLALTREKELAREPGTTSLEDEMAHLVGQLNKQWSDATRQR